MTHGRFSLTLLLALVLASSIYARAQSSPIDEAKAAAPNPEPQAPATLKGEGTAGRLPKFTGTYLLGNSVVTEGANGFLGINNTNPTAQLHIYEPPQPASVNNGASAPFLLQTTGGKGGPTTGSGTTGGRGASIYLSAGVGGEAPSGSTTGAGGSIFLRPGKPGVGGGTPGTTGNVLIADNNEGKVGVGISAPYFFVKMHVEGGNNNTALFATSTNGTAVYGRSSNAAAVFGYSDYGTAISGTGYYASSYAGHFHGRVRVVGALTVTQNVCAANIPCNSDARLKLGITNLNYGLRHLLQLRPVTWKWKEEPAGPLQLGLVAQEVEPIMPALVMRDADASKPLGLNYMGLLPVIVKAVQEQQAELESRDARIAELRAQVEQLEREKRSEVEALRAENEAVKARLDALERAVMRSADGAKQ